MGVICVRFIRAEGVGGADAQPVVDCGRRFSRAGNKKGPGKIELAPLIQVTTRINWIIVQPKLSTKLQTILTRCRE